MGGRGKIGVLMNTLQCNQHNICREKVCIYNSLEFLIVLILITGLWTVKMYIIMKFIFRKVVSLVQ